MRDIVYSYIKVVINVIHMWYTDFLVDISVTHVWHM